jgi:hypothetical protein
MTYISSLHVLTLLARKVSLHVHRRLRGDNISLGQRVVDNLMRHSSCSVRQSQAESTRSVVYQSGDLTDGTKDCRGRISQDRLENSLLRNSRP